MKKYIILIPLYNDWKSVSKVLNDIDLQISNWDADVSVVIINDASTEKRSGISENYKNIKSIKIINMKKNRVHQRCIAAGLKYIYKNDNFDRVIIMDADGEDRPEELNDLFKKANENPNKTITGNRFKRSESFLFRICYVIHKILTVVFTGKLIKFGNFTCLPREHVELLINKAYLWNTYSSSVFRTINDRTSIQVVRGTRHFGPSKMNFFSLIHHSLTIISVFLKEVIIRSVIFIAVYSFIFFDRFSLFYFFPILLLLAFVFIIYKISLRSNKKELEESLNNIGSIEVLGDSNSRQ